MFVVIKNGKRFLETASYPVACETARKDAYNQRLSMYTIWNQEKADPKNRSHKEAPLYRITGGVGYSIPNPPRSKAAA